MKWMWIDPGETVGWATGEVVDDKLTVTSYGQTKLKTFAMKLTGVAQNYDLIGYEGYQIRQSAAQAHVGSNVPTLQVIGMIRLAAWVAQQHNGDGTPEIVQQMPKDKNTGLKASPLYVDDELLAEIYSALSGSHSEGHFGDALLQMLAWYHTTYGKSVLPDAEKCHCPNVRFDVPVSPPGFGDGQP